MYVCVDAVFSKYTMSSTRLRQLNRAINLTSTDNAARRETPIVTAARMGLAECVALFIQLGINVRVNSY